MAASVLLAVVLVAAGAGKLMGQSAFLLELSRVFVSTGLNSFVGHVLPWIEILLAVSLLVGIAPQLAGGLTSVLFAGFIFHNVWLIAHGLGYQPCGCLGVMECITGGSLSTFGALYVDIVMFALALAVYFLVSGRVLDFTPWFWKKDTSRPKRRVDAVQGQEHPVD